jgi:hypothetical protein
MEPRRFLSGSSGPILQVICSTLPLLSLLIYFLVETAIRASKPPYTVTDGTEGYAETSLLPLGDIVFVFLFAALCWSLLAVYITFYIPRRHALVKRFLTEGEAVLGDVFYNDKSMCASVHHYGQVIYQHVNHDSYPVHVKRTVRVFERFTREKITVLLLPEFNFSGHVKEDLEIDQLVIDRNRDKLRFLKHFSWAWVIFTYIAPLYVLHVMGMNDSAADAWIYYFIIGGAVIPAVSVGVNALAWARLYHWTIRGDGKILVVDDRERKGWFEHDDCEMVDYQPPQPKFSASDDSSSDSTGVSSVQGSSVQGSDGIKSYRSTPMSTRTPTPYDMLVTSYSYGSTPASSKQAPATSVATETNMFHKQRPFTKIMTGIEEFDTDISGTSSKDTHTITVSPSNESGRHDMHL